MQILWNDLRATMRRLAERLGSERVVWRYDPLLFTSVTPPAYHQEQFARLAAALTQVVASAEVAPRLATLGVTPKQESPAATRERIIADVARWQAVVTAAGITP